MPHKSYSTTPSLLEIFHNIDYQTYGRLTQAYFEACKLVEDYMAI